MSLEYWRKNCRGARYAEVVCFRGVEEAQYYVHLSPALALEMDGFYLVALVVGRRVKGGRGASQLNKEEKIITDLPKSRTTFVII